MQDIEEGRPVIETEQQTKRILQVGSQRVSSMVYAKARELFRAGAIGELNLVEAWMNRNSANGAWQYSIPPDASPATIDWDRFIGNAPKRPFEPIRLFRWRNYRDYGTGFPAISSCPVHGSFFVRSLGQTRVMGMGLARLETPMMSGCDARALRLSDDAGSPARSSSSYVAEGGGDNRLSLRRTEGTSPSGRRGGGRKAARQEPGPPATRSRTRPAGLMKSTATSIRGAELLPTNKSSPRHRATTKPRALPHVLDAVRTRRAVVRTRRAATVRGARLLTTESYFEGPPPVGWDPARMPAGRSRGIHCRLARMIRCPFPPFPPHDPICRVLESTRRTAGGPFDPDRVTRADAADPTCLECRSPRIASVRLYRRQARRAGRHRIPTARAIPIALPIVPQPDRAAQWWPARRNCVPFNRTGRLFGRQKHVDVVRRCRPSPTPRRGDLGARQRRPPPRRPFEPRPVFGRADSHRTAPLPRCDHDV